MWVLVNVTDSARPTHVLATVAAEEGTAVMARDDGAGRSASVQGVDELARRRHRRAHRRRLGTLGRRRRSNSGT